MAIGAIAAALKLLGGISKAGAAAKIATSAGSGVRAGMAVSKFTKAGNLLGKLKGSGGSSNSGGGTSAPAVTSTQLHPMAQRAMSLDMGFYGHSKATGPKTVKNPSTSMPHKADRYCKYTNVKGKR